MVRLSKKNMNHLVKFCCLLFGPGVITMVCSMTGSSRKDMEYSCFFFSSSLGLLKMGSNICIIPGGVARVFQDFKI